MADVLLVTGMHRSGTSLLASWCEQMGLRIHLGRAIGPYAGNPKGHFEDVEFVDLHAGAVRQVGHRTSGWKANVPEFLEFSEAHRAQARQLIEARCSAPPWGWKDPRSVLFLEEWHRLLPELRVLLVWRPAQSVVASILRRSARRANADMNIGWLEAARVWRTYNLLILRYKARYPERSLLVPLSAVLTADRAVYELVSGQLGLDLDYRPIHRLYEHNLMHDRLVDRHTIMARAVAAVLGCSDIEERLRNLSDLGEPA